MNILHLNTGMEGGAAICARRIHKALLQQGIVSQMLVARGVPTSDVTVAKPVPDRWYANPWGSKMKHLLMRTPFFWDREKMDILLRQSCPANSKGPYCHHHPEPPRGGQRHQRPHDGGPEGVHQARQRG